MNEPPQKTIPAAFYRTASGIEPVREWLKGLDAEDRRIIGTDIRTVEFGWPVGMPACALWVAAYSRSAARSRKSGFLVFYSAFTEKEWFFFTAL